MLKKFKPLAAILLLCLLTNCVQKTSHKTVIYILKINGMKNVKSVGIRGKDKPLNWDTNFNLLPIKKDSSYKATVSYDTGYKFTEVKFVVEGEFELKNNANRRINFSDKDTTVFYAEFNKLNNEKQ